VPEGSSRVPLRNCAHLGWQIVQEEACYTSYANPTLYAYLPLIVRNYALDLGEPNNTPEQAFGPLASGQVYQAFIWDEADTEDYYHFTPTTADEVSVELSNIPAGHDYDLWIYSYDGKYNLVDYSNNTGNANEYITFTPVAGEPIYVRVWRFDGFGNAQPYHLMVIYQ
jgi:hypothetical protein